MNEQLEHRTSFKDRFHSIMGKAVLAFAATLLIVDGAMLGTGAAVGVSEFVEQAKVPDWYDLGEVAVVALGAVIGENIIHGRLNRKT